MVCSSKSKEQVRRHIAEMVTKSMADCNILFLSVVAEAWQKYCAAQKCRKMMSAGRSKAFAIAFSTEPQSIMASVLQSWFALVSKEKTLRNMEQALDQHMRAKEQAWDQQVRAAKDEKLKVTAVLCENLEGLHFAAMFRAWQAAAKESSLQGTLTRSLLSVCFQHWVHVSETGKRVQKERVRFAAGVDRSVIAVFFDGLQLSCVAMGPFQSPNSPGHRPSHTHLVLLLAAITFP